MTERDEQMLVFGQITNLSIKALYASEKATPTTAPISHRDMAISLMNRLLQGDPSLSDYVTDKRTLTGLAEVIINPIGVSQKIAEAEQAEQAEQAQELTKPIDLTELDKPIEQTPTRIPNMALNMITIPDPKWAKAYINRRFNGVSDWDIYDHALANDINVLVEGEAGSGKTFSVQSYASARKKRYFNVSNNNGIDPSQLFGRWIPNPQGQGYVWQDGAVTLLVRHGGVLLLNEVNFLPARVSTVLFSLLEYRREIQLLENGGEVIKAHPDLLIVADMNYGYKGTQELNQAFQDRFAIKLEFPYDRAIENKLVKNKSLLTLADQLREQYEKEEISQPISTRALVAFISNMNAFGIDFAITSFINGFNKDERSGVRLACETHKDNIANEAGHSIISAPIIENEEYTNEVLA
jgi:hypothetical protein